MKKATYIIGSIEITVGIIMLSIASVIEQVMPLLGRIAWQTAAAGGYTPSDYAVSFPLVTIASIVLIILGALQVCYGIIKKEK